MTKPNHILIPVQTNRIITIPYTHTNQDGTTKTHYDKEYPFEFTWHTTNHKTIQQWKNNNPPPINQPTSWYIFWFNGQGQCKSTCGPLNTKNRAQKEITNRHKLETKTTRLQKERNQARTKQRTKRHHQMKKAAKQLTQQWHNNQYLHPPIFFRNKNHKNHKNLELTQEGLETPNTQPIAIWELPKITGNIRPLIIHNGHEYHLYGYKGDKPINNGSLRIPQKMMIKLNINY